MLKHDFTPTSQLLANLADAKPNLLPRFLEQHGSPEGRSVAAIQMFPSTSMDAGWTNHQEVRIGFI
jgi:hypothetical protein